MLTINRRKIKYQATGQGILLFIFTIYWIVVDKPINILWTILILLVFTFLFSLKRKEKSDGNNSTD